MNQILHKFQIHLIFLGHLYQTIKSLQLTCSKFKDFKQRLVKLVPSLITKPIQADVLIAKRGMNISTIVSTTCQARWHKMKTNYQVLVNHMLKTQISLIVQWMLGVCKKVILDHWLRPRLRENRNIEDLNNWKLG